MDVDRVRDALGGTRFADVRWVPQTGSTNADVLDLARQGTPEGVVLVADHQTAGRGRLGRTWQAPPGASLLLSLLLRPSDAPTSLPVEHLFQAQMALGLAAAIAVREATRADVRLKWPNDLVIDIDGATRKLSGILAESIVEEGRVAALVIGIGVNVNWPADVPDDLRDIATAANHLAGHDLDREAILVDLLRGMDARYRDIAAADGRSRLREQYRSLSATIGRRVRVELAGETVVGDAIDLTDEGHLLVVDECPDRPREITAGDVVHLRPAD